MYQDSKLVWDTEIGDKWVPNEGYVVISPDSYPAVVKALWRSRDPKGKPLAKQLWKLKTGARKCAVCGNVSYTCVPAHKRIGTWDVGYSDPICSRCVNKKYPVDDDDDENMINLP